MPRISVITPTYNRHDMIGRAIESVLRQTFTDWEMLIVDDCPTKPAEVIVRRYNDPRITYIKHDSNKGGAEARNTAMRASSGDFFCFIDDDDEWLPNALEILFGAVKDTPPEVGFCFASIEMDYSNGKKVRTHVPEVVADYHERALRNFSGFIGQGLIVKRAVYEDVGGWDPALPSHQEIEWVIRMTKKYKACGVDKPVVHIFINDGHARIGNNLPKRILGREILLERYKDDFAAHPKYLARHLFLLAMWCREIGDHAKARSKLRRVYALDHSLRTFAHYLLLCLNGIPYRALRAIGFFGKERILEVGDGVEVKHRST
jgi:glycosyltransferase involved in cell wall biosynthesis